MGRTHSINGVPASFIVGPDSNDDPGAERFLQLLKERISKAPKDAGDLFCAFCPSREPRNDSRYILEQAPFVGFDEIHILLLKHKWDFHAELRTTDIINYLSGNLRVRFVVIDLDSRETTDEERSLAREGQIVSYLEGIYP